MTSYVRQVNVHDLGNPGESAWISGTLPNATLAGSTLIVIGAVSCYAGTRCQLAQQTGDASPGPTGDLTNGQYIEVANFEDTNSGADLALGMYVYQNAAAVPANTQFVQNFTAGDDYIGITIIEIANVAANSLITSQNVVQTIAGSGTNNITTGNAALGSNACIVVGLSIGTINGLLPNPGTAANSQNTGWGWGSSPPALVESQNFPNPGSNTIYFSSTGADDYMTVTVALKDYVPVSTQINIGASSFNQQGTRVSTVTSNTISTNTSGSGFYVATLQGNTTPGTVTITDSCNNVYTRIGSQLGDGNSNWLDRFYCQNGTGSASHNVTATLSTGTAVWDLFFSEIINGDKANLYVSSNTSNGFTGSPYATGNVSTSNNAVANGDLLITIFGTNVFSPTSITVANSFNVISTSNNNNAINGGWAYKVVNTASSFGASWSDGGANYSVLSIDSFQGNQGTTTPGTQFKMYANGAMQAHLFSQGALPANTAMRLYSNNTVHTANLVVNGGGKIRLFANGTLVCNNTIIV